MTGLSNHAEADERAALDEQRRRYELSYNQLTALITRGRESRPRVLFGVDLSQAEEATEDHRFPNEIVALRSYVRGGIALGSAGGPTKFVTDEEILVERDRRRVGNNRPTVRVANRKSRNSGQDAVTQRHLENFVDVGICLARMHQRQVILLIRYYVWGERANDLASDYQITPSALGGRISQARRALRKAVAQLLPKPQKRATTQQTTQSAQQEWLEERREKVSRMLRARRENKCRFSIAEAQQ